ncbi:hypothetical protein LV716_04160 [Flagellimonas sp. HMM57]|uniref:hypothetical protein n=1 Tax=unclassified Flagellimonas TaxID=2644544 RepID=UPI0013D32671|nr:MULTISPECIES: hypothetical protein [unclassified Flagellimonas]UII76991.1 hypothetical protein LV716_04160 [Flagellimonas sp. HMM57]
MTKTILRMNFIVLFFVLITSCSRDKKNNISVEIVERTECDGCKEYSDCISLTFINVESDTEIDWTVFELFEDDFQDSEILKTHSLNEVLNIVEDDQIVVENSKGDKRFFSEVRTFDTETIPVSSVFRIKDDGGSIDMLKSNVTFNKKLCINTNRLKVKKDDEQIRLNWLVKNKNKGGEGMVLKSNWINL